MSKVTRHVVRCFPDRELAIERLARSSESFREMCEDYNDGLETLEQWRQAARRQAEVDELRDSLVDLEAEILAALERAMRARSG